MSDHGTRAKYVRDRCRCDACRTANTRRLAEWRRRKAEESHGARPPSLVDAGPARRHVRALMDAGVGWKRVAELSGVAPSVVSKLIYGAPFRGAPPSARIRPVTEHRLLAVKADVADGALVDATGSRRRLQALMAVGWSGSRLGRELGLDPTNFHAMIHRARVEAATARAVRHLYDRLWDRAPKAGSRWEAGAITRAKAAARRLGWAPPVAWDDDTIDDPAARPDVGERGSSRLDLAEVEHLAAGGCSLEETARRMGVTVSAIEQARGRARRAGAA